MIPGLRSFRHGQTLMECELAHDFVVIFPLTVLILPLSPVTETLPLTVLISPLFPEMLTSPLVVSMDSTSP